MLPIPLNISRVVVTQDVYWLAGAIKVAKGARGTVTAKDGDRWTILFDETDHYVEDDGFGRRHQYVPFGSVEFEAVHEWSAARAIPTEAPL